MRPFRSVAILVTAAALVGGALPAGALEQNRASASPRTVTSTGFTDLGVVDDVYTVRAVNDEGDALIHDAASTWDASDGYGRWHDGTLSAPQPIDSDCEVGSYTSVGLAPDGAVIGDIGYDNTQGSCAGTVGYAQGTRWPLDGDRPVEWPHRSDETRGSCGYLQRNPLTVDDQGEVGVEGEVPNSDKVGPECPNTDDQGFIAAEDGSSVTGVPALTGVRSLSRDWATDGGSTLVNRGSGAVTTLTLSEQATVGSALSDDGTIAGEQLRPGAGSGYAAYQSVGGPVTPLLLPADATSGGSSAVYAQNGAGELVGYADTATGSGALFWPSRTAQPVELDAAVQLPSGWQLDAAQAISPDGLLAGTAEDAEGRTHDIEFRAGRTNDLSATIAVADPQGKPLSGASTGKGKSFVATVTLAEAGDAPAAITGLTSSLTAAPGSKVTRTASTPVPATLQPGQSLTYTTTYTITGTGSLALSVMASGAEDDGDGAPATEQATGQLAVQLGQPIQVDVAFLQNGQDLAASPLGVNTLKLGDDDNGEVAQDVDVRETLTNISGVALTDVSVQDPDLAVADPASAHDPFEAGLKTKPNPAGFATLAAGAAETVEFALHVTGNQQFQVRQLVLASDPAYGDTERSTGEGDLTVLPSALLLVDLKPDASVPSAVKTGRLVQLNGTVRNLSNTQALDLDPVLARITGNGGGQTSADKATPTADGFTAPVTGKVAPGDKQSFHVLVQTMVNGGTRATVTTTPTGRLVLADGTEQQLTAAQIRTTAGTSPTVLHLDDSDPAPEAAPDYSTAAYLFTASALEGLRDWTANGFHSIADLASVGKIGDGVVAAGGIVADNLQTDYEIVSVIKAELALHVFWGVLTPAQKSAFAEQVAIDTDAASDSFKQFHGAIAGGVQSYFQGFQNDFQGGHVAAAWQDLGHGIGTGVPEALTLLAPEVVLGKVARGLGWGVRAAGAVGDTSVARLISLAAKLKDAKIVGAAAKAIDGVAAGDNLLASGAKVLKRSFGLAQRDIDIFTSLAKRRDLLVAVRQRNPITTAWLKTKKFLVKPELIKIKNVDELDVEFLGYQGKRGLIGRGDYGTVVFKEPDPLSDVYDRLLSKKASPEVRKAALKRYSQRVEEWKKYRKLYEGYDEKGIVDLGFDKAAQGAGTKGRDLRKFHLENVDTASGRKYYKVQISDARGVLKGITGDIDIVAILNADGTLPSAAVRAALYDDLLKAVGMQHGETFSWIFEGELLSKTKAKLLADHLPGNEQLAVFGPDGGCRAAYFDPKLTVFNTQSHEAYATFVGAYTTALQKVQRYASLALGSIT